MKKEDRPDIITIIREALYQFVDDCYGLPDSFEITVENERLKIVSGKHKWVIREEIDKSFTSK